MPEGLDKIIF